ncbi:hypothetical protein G6F24_017571 [Rhizopus arrhizus]|nr:hypothetical protein G6F24_017571 [Rhizopus arrhizus]
MVGKIGLGPAQPGGRAGLGAVFAADPAGVAQRVDPLEQVGIVQFAQVGLVPVGHAGDLDVADARHIALQLHGDVAFDDLAVIAVELHFQVGCADLGADGLRVVLA